MRFQRDGFMLLQCSYPHLTLQAYYTSRFLRELEAAFSWFMLNIFRRTKHPY